MKATALAFISLVLLAAACSGGTGASQPPSQAPTVAPSQPSTRAPSQPPTAMPSEMAGGVTITVMQSDLGAYLAGPNGHALYVLTNDSTNSSTCTGSCAQTWPPLTIDTGQSVEPGDGVTGTIDSFARDDGGTQVSVGGMPVYYFSGDAAAGQTNGQGIGGVWFLAAPDGSPLGAAGAVDTSSPAASAAASPDASIHIRY